MIHLDTSVLVESLSGSRRLGPAMRQAILDGETFGVSTLVLYEWRRGARRAAELHALDFLVPRDRVIAFGAVESARAADLYRTLARPRGREIDVAIAACAIVHGAALWTLNVTDFRDIVDLDLYQPPRP
jgi:predicted nucleic acid-binding protein